MILTPAPRDPYLPPGDSLALGPGGMAVALIGASNGGGFADTGFGDAPNTTPFPSGFGLYINGTTPAVAWTDPHGPVVGFVQALLDAGKSASGLTWVQRHVAGSDLAAWYSGEDMAGDLIGYCTTIGVTPRLIVAILSSADTGTLNAANQVDEKFRRGLAPMLSAWNTPAGPPSVILCGPNQESDTGYATAVAAAHLYCRTERTGRRAYVTMSGLTKQPSGSTHLSHVGQMEFGARIWAPVARAGILRLVAA